MYRDNLAAARAQTAALARSLMERSASLRTLVDYRAALRVEVARLRHAVVWYENGERYGFNRFRERDDLSPATPSPPTLPTWTELDQALAKLDAAALDFRLHELHELLGRDDPRVDGLQRSVDGLRREATALRQRVDGYAARHPDHPPPPEFDPTAWAVSTTVAVVGGVWAVLSLLLG